MNKKFLLLPLVAMTASVYAAEDEYIKITPDTTGLSAAALEQVAGEAKDIPGLIQFKQSPTDESTEEIYINKNNQIEALNKLIDLIKEVIPENQNQFQITKEKALNSTKEDILKDTTYDFEEQATKISLAEGTILITPEIKKGQKYQDIKLNEEQEISLQQLKDQIQYQYAAIKDYDKFLREKGELTIKLQNGEKANVIDTKIQELITAAGIKTEDYSTIKKPIAGLDPTDPFAQFKFKHTDAQQVDQNSDKFKLYTSALKEIQVQKDTNKTLTDEIDNLKQQIQLLTQQKTQLQSDLETEKKHIKKPQYTFNISKTFAELAEKYQQYNKINSTVANEIINTIHESTMTKHQANLRIPGNTQQAQVQKTTYTKIPFFVKDQETMKKYQNSKDLMAGAAKNGKVPFVILESELSKLYNPKTDTQLTTLQLSQKIVEKMKEKGYIAEANAEQPHNIAKAATLLYNEGKMDYDIENTIYNLLKMMPQIKEYNAKTLKDTFDFK